MRGKSTTRNATGCRGVIAEFPGGGEPRGHFPFHSIMSAFRSGDGGLVRQDRPA